MNPAPFPDLESEGGFSSMLRSLHEVSMELAVLADTASLTETAVGWGLANLGFDRISLWFIDREDPDFNVGTWGTDESGNLRDERGARVRRDPIIAPPEFYEGRVPVLAFHDQPCYDERRNIVGRADKALAPLWDGSCIIGELSVDNFLSKRAIGPRSLEILVLYARIIAHLHSLIDTRTALAAALDQRGILLREVKHRTKNNLAVIAGMVGLEAARAGSAEARETLGRVGSRIGALAALYTLLDRNTESESVRLDEYLMAVARGVMEGQGAEIRGVGLALDVRPVSVRAGSAAPLGIALNELMTDAFKHAFNQGRGGRLVVRLSGEGGRAELEVSDDGPGLPADFRLDGGEGLGLGLVGLLARQVGADFSWGSGPGARFTLRFPSL